MNSPFKNIHTSCKNCHFARYEPATAEEPPTQVGCELGRLERFEAVDPGCVLEVYDDEVDEAGVRHETNFNVINGRVCNTFRDRRAGGLAKSSETVRKEVTAAPAIFLVLEDQPALREAIQASCAALKAQTLPPSQVFFVNNQDTIKQGALATLLHRELGNAVTWRMVDVKERAADGSRVSAGAAIDSAMSKAVTALYYAVFRPGFPIPSRFCQALDEAINDRLERFVGLCPLEYGDGLVVQTALHKSSQVCGNAAAMAPWDDRLAREAAYFGYKEGDSEILLDSIEKKLNYMTMLDGDEALFPSVAMLGVFG